MEEKTFENVWSKYAGEIQDMMDKSHALRSHVNLNLDDISHNTCPVRFVVEEVRRYAAQVVQQADDVLPLVFAACFHDALVNLRMNYVELVDLAKTEMGEQQAEMAADLVFALTPNKGKRRKECYNRDFYEALKATPYGPLMFLCIRLGQVRYMAESDYRECCGELRFYDDEFPFLLRALEQNVEDARLTFPESLADTMFLVLSSSYSS